MVFMGWNPLYHGLLKVGEGRREGVVSFYAGERRVDLHVADGYLLKATGLVPLSLFCPGADGGELKAVEECAARLPRHEVWYALAAQASATLLGLPSLPGRKRLVFTPNPVPLSLHVVGAGFRLNEEVLSLFYPEVSVLAWEEWEDPFLLSFL